MFFLRGRDRATAWAGGLGTASFEAGEPVPVELMLSWIDESYRAIAAKKLVKELGEKLR